jgi:trk system potassium uptake protein
VGLIVVGWVLFTWFEWTNPATLGALPGDQSIVNGLFHSITPRTAGFNSVDMAAIGEPARLLTEILMFIGGGSGSTAGGIKVTTFAVLGWVIWAELRGEPDVTAFERRLPTGTQRKALTVALVAVGAVMAATMLVLASTDLSQSDVFFETISALGTVGLSTGVTPLLSGLSEVVIIVVMLLGRVGPPTLFTALVLRERGRLYRHPEERVIIG